MKRLTTGGLFACLLCYFSDSGAQSGLYFEHYSTDRGLSQGSGYAITSHDDYLWFGTQEGVNQFDGYRMNVFKTRNSPGLPDNFINALCNDSRGRLWVGTAKGLCVYNDKTQQFNSFSDVAGFSHAVSNQSVSKLAADQNGQLWIITAEKGLYRYDTRRNQVKGYFTAANNMTALALSPIDKSVWLISDAELFRFDPDKDLFVPVYLRKNGLTKDGVILRTIAIDGQNNLWIGTYEEGIFVLSGDGSSRLLRRFQKGSSPTTISANEITSLFCDHLGRMWIGHRRSGISVYNPQQNRFFYSVHTPTNPRSIATNYVLSFHEDQQHNVWIGLSGGGIDKYDPLKYPFGLIQKNIGNAGNSISDNMVFKIHGNSNYLYFGTQTGGLSELNRKTNLFKTYLPEAGNPKSIIHSQVYDISPDSAGRLWLATGRGLCLFNPVTKNFSVPVNEKENNKLLYLYAIKVLRNQQEIWAGGERGLFRIDLKTGEQKLWSHEPDMEKISQYIQRIIYEDQEGIIWLGTQSHGLVRYDPVTRSVVVLDEKTGLHCTNIRSFYEEKQRLWVGTDCGIYVVDKQTATILNYYSEDDSRATFQLANNVIYGVLKDVAGYYWLSSNRGLEKFSETRGVIKTFDQHDGLQSDEFNTNCTYADSDGKLYFGGVNGVNYFQTSDIKTNTYIPPVKITDIQVINLPISPGSKNLILNSDQNFINFRFAAFNFSNTQKNTYQYKLEGINNEWVNAGPKNYADYTNLPPGEYRFSVKGYNNDGLVNPKEASIGILITPPYYQRWWFRLLMGMLATSVFFGFYKNQIDKKLLRANLEKESLKASRQEAELKEREASFQRQITQTEISALRSQMNPHFIFNCLNSIQFFTAQNDTVKASDYLAKFARLIRLVLENSRSEHVTLANELETLQLYIDMEAMRFQQKVSSRIIVDESIDTESIQIPPLLLQPFVENAIWHGLMHKPEGGLVTVQVTQPQPSRLHVEITDNGVGRAKAAEFRSKSATKNKSMGMKVTAERIALINQLYNTQTNVTVLDLFDEANRPAGTRVLIDIPV